MQKKDLLVNVLQKKYHSILEMHLYFHYVSVTANHNCLFHFSAQSIHEKFHEYLHRHELRNVLLLHLWDSHFYLLYLKIPSLYSFSLWVRLLCLRQIRIYQETFSQISSLESEKFSATILAISIK